MLIVLERSTNPIVIKEVFLRKTGFEKVTRMDYQETQGLFLTRISLTEKLYLAQEEQKFDTAG